VREADNLPPSSADVKKSRSLTLLDPSGPAWPVTGVLYLYLFLIHFNLTATPVFQVCPERTIHEPIRSLRVKEKERDACLRESGGGG
jgi:hypothetical protein